MSISPMEERFSALHFQLSELIRSARNRRVKDALYRERRELSKIHKKLIGSEEALPRPAYDEAMKMFVEVLETTERAAAKSDLVEEAIAKIDELLHKMDELVEKSVRRQRTVQRA